LLQANAAIRELKDSLEARVAERSHELKLSEQRYRSIFEQSHIGLFELDMRPLKRLLDGLRAEGVTDLASYIDGHPDFRRECAESAIIIDVNEATIRTLGGKNREEILGPIAPFVRTTDGMTSDRIFALFTRAPSYQGTVHLNRLDGEPLTVLYGLVYPSDEDGFERIVAGMVDVTERERAQRLLFAAREDLARATRAAALGALSASIAHDLNQPIGALVMDAQSAMRWLERDPPDMAAARRALDRVVRNGNRASEIAGRTRKNLVDGRRRVTPVDLLELTLETRDLLRHELDASGVTLRVAKGDGTPRVDADRTELQQVLVNLILNAAQAMVSHGRIRREIAITMRQLADGHVRLSVKDNGPGISDAIRARLFEPFFSTKAEGMGMGLAICRATIAAFGGNLVAENRPEGGAEFWFSLPPSDLEHL
jgi:C4-dicarboxylate-specific signal transduction histidine kinase